MKITRIKPPKYRVGKYVLNEYELRSLMLEVCLGMHDPEKAITVRDEEGNTALIKRDGSLTNNLYGTGIMSSFTLGMLRNRREQEQIVNSKK